MARTPERKISIERYPPRRTRLALAKKEAEAELAAWHIAACENLVVVPPIYLKSCMEKHPDAVERVDLDREVRSIARVRAYLGDPPIVR